MGICCKTQGTQQGLCDNLEGWDGKEMEGRFGREREGTWVYPWLILVDV